MKTLTILNKSTKDAKAFAAYDDSLRGGDLISYKDEDGIVLEGIVSFSKKWENAKYSELPMVEIIK